MPLLGEILSLGCALVWATAVIFFRVAGLSLNAWNLNLFKNLVALALFLPTLLLLHGLAWPLPSWSDTGLLVISGILGITLADTYYFQALNLLGATRTAVVSCLYSPIVLVLSVLFLGERSGAWQGLGFLLVLGGVLLVSARKAKKEIDTVTLWKGLGYGVLAEFLMAVGIIITKPIVEGQSAIVVSALRLAAGAAGMLAWSAATGSLGKVLSGFTSGPLPWRTLFIGSFLGSYLSMMLWIAGYKFTDASIAAILNQTSVLFIIGLAAIFLKEALTARKIAGAALGVAGVLVILLAP